MRILEICLASSLFGLALIYYAARMIQPVQIPISDIDSSLVGRKVATTGYITNRKFHKNGHIFLTISDGQTKIQVPIFSNLVNALPSSNFDLSQLNTGKEISVIGLVDFYKGQLQLIPQKPDDIKVVG